MRLNIKRMRLEKGLTQEELATRVSIGRVNINRYETGKRTPSIDTARKIAAALDCTIDELFGKPEKEKEEVQ